MTNAEQLLNKMLEAKSQADEDLKEWFEPTMPDSWVDEQGLRHAVVYGGDGLNRVLLEKVNGHWVHKDLGVF